MECAATKLLRVLIHRFLTSPNMYVTCLRMHVAKFTSSLETTLDATRKPHNKPRNRSVSGFHLISRHKSLKIYERIIVARFSIMRKRTKIIQMCV